MHPATGSWRAHSESEETTERRRVNSGSGLGSTSQRFLQSGFTRAQSLRSFSPLRFVPCCADFNRLVYLPQLRENVARQNTGNGQGLVRRQKMFLFVPLRRGEKSRGSFAVVASLRLVRGDTEARRHVFWPSLVFCYLVFDIGRKLMLWNRMQWVSSQQEPKTLAISGRW